MGLIYVFKQCQEGNSMYFKLSKALIALALFLTITILPSSELTAELGGECSSPTDGDCSTPSITVTCSNGQKIVLNSTSTRYDGSCYYYKWDSTWGSNALVNVGKCTGVGGGCDTTGNSWGFVISQTAS